MQFAFERYFALNIDLLCDQPSALPQSITDAKISSTEIQRMEQVRTGLRQIMSDLLRACPPEEAVSLAWPIVCGKEVAARTRVASFADGRLTVEVPDKAWQNQLQSFTARYMAGYADFFGELVKSMRFVLKQSAGSNQQSAKP